MIIFKNDDTGKWLIFFAWDYKILSEVAALYTLRRAAFEKQQLIDKLPAKKWCLIEKKADI